MTSVRLGSRTVHRGGPPYLIAEIGVNHEGNLALAKTLIELAKEGGADAAKFQSYTAGRIASRHSPSYWDTAKEPTRSQFELFSKYDKFGPEEYGALAEHCRRVGIDFASTPFDAGAVEFLDPLVPFFKVASADITNVPLLRQIASKGKPILLSTGASTLGEVDAALAVLAAAGFRHEVVLLHCILNYPCANENAHLNMIEGLQRVYPEKLIGYSDHTVPDPTMLVLTAAWLKGAAVLEKHFTHDKSLPGNDHYHAMDVHDLKRFRSNLALLTQALGEGHKRPLPEEQPAREHARRSIVLEHAMTAGQAISAEDITAKRPAHGIGPQFWDEVLGRKLARDLGEDHVLQWQDLA